MFPKLELWTYREGEELHWKILLSLNSKLLMKIRTLKIFKNLPVEQRIKSSLSKANFLEQTIVEGMESKTSSWNIDRISFPGE